jgi:tetratricopeptide (TPR) repeat protein
VFIHHYGSRTFVGNRIDYGASLSGNRKVFTEKWSGKDAVQRFGKKLRIENAINRADEFFQKGDIENATASMLEALKQAPDDRSLYFKLAEMLIDAKRYNDAFGILESMHQVAADARRLALLGYCEEGLGHDEKANEYAERALAIDPSMPLALNILGVVAHKRGEQETAEALFKKAIESDTGFGESYTNLGSLKWAAGEDIEALNSLERGFILSPTIADVATAYHAAVVESRSFERAEPVFREAKALHPKNKRIAFLMIALLIQQEKNKLAMQEIENAMIQFGIDDGILSAGLEIRKKIGFLEADKSNRKKASLSLCMIARNEEPHLAKCLMSVKPIVNEMIVVDTGSSDRTKNIAAALGAKVFDYPWTNDFSEARNYSLSKASGDWILVLDADEVVSPLDYHKLLNITVRRPRKPVAYTVLTRNYTNNAGSRGWVANEGRYAGEEAGKGWVPSPKVRLFVNDRRIQFVNPVHELVEPTLAKLGIKVKACDVPVHHYGRLDQDKLVAKGKEYYRLGIAKIEQTKGDYNALKELAIQASEIGEYEAAVNVWQKVIEIQSKDAVAHMNMGFAFLMMRKYDRAIEFSKIAMELDPELREAALNYSAAEMIAGDIRTAISTLEDLLEKNADYPPAMGRLAAAYMVTGRKEEGFRYLDKLKSKGFDCASALEEQSRSFIAEGKIEPAAVLLKSAIEKGIANGSINDLFAECRSKIDCSTPTCKPIDFTSSLPLQTAELQRNTATI